MGKTYTAPTTVSAGDAITASLYNTYVGTNVANLIVPPAVLLRRVANQSISNNTETNMSWDTEDVDTDSMWSSGTTITIQTSGIYVVSMFINFGAANGTGLREIAFKKNGVGGIGSNTSMPNSSYTHNVTASAIFSAVATDTITAVAFQSSGSAMNLTGNISVVWMGRTS